MFSEGTEVILWSDHKLLDKFLKGTTRNNKVDHWSFEFSGYSINVKWLPGVLYILADTLSALINFKINKEIYKKIQFEFRKYLFDVLPVVENTKTMTDDTYLS